VHWTSLDHLLLIAHGSGIPSYDDDFRASILSFLSKSIPSDQLHLGFLRGSPSCFDSLSEVPLHATLHALPLVLADGLLAASLIPNTVTAAWEKLHHQVGSTPSDIHFIPHPGYSSQLFQLVAPYVSPNFLPVSPEEVSVLVISHGNSRHHSSLADDLCTRFRKTYPQIGSWHAAYLNQAPEIADVFHAINEQTVIVIPWFLCPGNHVSLCIPPRLDFSPQTDPADLFTWHQVGSKRLFYAPPVCMHDEWMQAILAAL
jgi:hypothetical protein